MIKLDNGHRWDVGQTFGRLPENPNASFKAPDKTWVAVIVDTRTGRSVVKSALSATRGEAIADAERQYKNRSGR
ncbi:hypothetical protein ACWD48_19605 [Streptomyces sp. NPDC002519]